MKRNLCALLAVALLASVPLAAQGDGAMPAPKLLQIYREMVKPGHNAAHEKVEAGWPKAHKASKTPAHYLAMTSLTGANEAWYLSGYESYEAWEKQFMAEQADPVLAAEITRLSAADGEHLDGWRSITARFREDLSLRPALNIGSYRYMTVVTMRVRPGMQSRFVETRKTIKAAHEKAGLKDYYSIFEVNSGMVGPTYLLFIPMKSLKEADESAAMHASAPYQEALGGEEGSKKMAESNAAAILSTESAIFAFSPKMSNPPQNYSLGGNADYWNPKPAPAMKPKAAAPAKKE
jgi:hypothetical protein